MSYSLRAANAKNDDARCSCVVDVVATNPKPAGFPSAFTRIWSTIPMNWATSSRPLMGKDACCLNLEEDDPAMRDYILARLGEAAASAAK